MQVTMKSTRLLRATKLRWLCTAPNGNGQPRFGHAVIDEAQVKVVKVRINGDLRVVGAMAARLDGRVMAQSKWKTSGGRVGGAKAPPSHGPVRIST